jgi:hypothetical protein
LRYDDICSSIFGIDPKIRFVAIYHKSGQILGGGTREGLEPYLPREEITRSAINAIMRWETRKLLFPFVGEGKYSMTEYQKVKRLTVPMGEAALLLVTMDVTANHTFIINKIQEILNEDFR